MTRKSLAAIAGVIGVSAVVAGAVLAQHDPAGGGPAGRRAAAPPIAVAGAPTIVRASAGVPSSGLHCRIRRRRFRTLPGLRPVGFCLAARRGARLSGDLILVSPRPDPRKDEGEQFGLMIVTTGGKLLWYSRRPDKVHDLKVVEVGRRRLLAFYQRRPRSQGVYELLDDHYRPVRELRPGRGRPTNLHELQLTPQGTAYLSSDVSVRVPGAGKVIKFVVQEIDVATGKVLFEWDSLDHVPLRDSVEGRPRDGRPWDYFHGNAIAPPVPGDRTVMISSRNTSAVYGIDRRTGRTHWTFGGLRDDFGLARRHRAWRFCTQHDAHRLPDGDIMLFDNGGTYLHGPRRCPLHPARAMRFRLDIRHRRARLVRQVRSQSLTRSGRGYLSGWVGSTRFMSGGDLLVDWGPNGRVTAHRPDGRADLLLRLQFWSYRATPVRWVGSPDGVPAVAAERRGGTVRIWASWNGATEIRRWQVLAGDRADALAPAGAPLPFADLETRMDVRTAARFIAVRALDAAGGRLGESRAVVPR